MPSRADPRVAGATPGCPIKPPSKIRPAIPTTMINRRKFHCAGCDNRVGTLEIAKAGRIAWSDVLRSSAEVVAYAGLNPRQHRERPSIERHASPRLATPFFGLHYTCRRYPPCGKHQTIKFACRCPYARCDRMLISLVLGIGSAAHSVWERPRICPRRTKPRRSRPAIECPLARPNKRPWPSAASRAVQRV